jgi:glycosyltransferase involved in cell wall biosynthesis
VQNAKSEEKRKRPLNIEQSTWNTGRKEAGSSVRVLQILHTLRRAGAEELVYELATANREQIQMAVVCLDEEGALADELRKAGVKIFFTHRRPGIDLSQVTKIASAIREFQPGVIHCHQYTPFFYGAIAVRRAKIGKVLFTEHGRHWPDVVGWKRRFFNRWWLGGQASRITSVSRFTQDRLVEKDGFPRERIEIIYNGVDVSRFENPAEREKMRTELGLAADAKVVVQVGTFRRVKDQATAIKAFRIVRSRIADVKLVFVGDGPDLAGCRKLADETGLRESILFLGPRSDIPRILSAGDMMLMTSLSEAHSVSLLEGMAAGLAIVATDVGGNGDGERRRNGTAGSCGRCQWDRGGGAGVAGGQREAETNGSGRI